MSIFPVATLIVKAFCVCTFINVDTQINPRVFLNETETNCISGDYEQCDYCLGDNVTSTPLCYEAWGNLNKMLKENQFEKE